ncbi:MAG: phosphoglycolate phosphatase [Polyangiales bacterium]
MAAPTVFLFDIDGTLISTGGAGRRAMASAFGAVCDAPHALKGVKLGGMTDRLILRAGFEAIGRTFSETLFTSVMDEYLQHLTHEVKTSEGYIVYEGVHEAVEACRAISGSATGLGTGNIEAGARIKLQRSGLDQHFAFGGFGSDAEDRAELIEAGARRGADALGVARNGVRVVVIGDTPRDVHAAHAIGARCICVATGGFTFEELEAASADAVFHTLAAPGAVDAITAASVS